MTVKELITRLQAVKEQDAIVELSYEGDWPREVRSVIEGNTRKKQKVVVLDTQSYG